MELHSIAMPALILIGILGLILSARFGGWGGMSSPGDRR
jgi:hypothetical protein